MLVSMLNSANTNFMMPIILSACVGKVNQQNAVKMCFHLQTAICV